MLLIQVVAKSTVILLVLWLAGACKSTSFDSTNQSTYGNYSPSIAGAGRDVNITYGNGDPKSDDSFSRALSTACRHFYNIVKKEISDSVYSDQPVLDKAVFYEGEYELNMIGTFCYCANDVFPTYFYENELTLISSSLESVIRDTRTELPFFDKIKEYMMFGATEYRLQGAGSEFDSRWRSAIRDTVTTCVPEAFDVALGVALEVQKSKNNIQELGIGRVLHSRDVINRKGPNKSKLNEEFSLSIERHDGQVVTFWQEVNKKFDVEKYYFQSGRDVGLIYSNRLNSYVAIPLPFGQYALDVAWPYEDMGDSTDVNRD